MTFKESKRWMWVAHSSETERGDTGGGVGKQKCVVTRWEQWLELSSAWRRQNRRGVRPPCFEPILCEETDTLPPPPPSLSPGSSIFSLLWIESGLRGRSHLLSDRCCAGNPSWQAPACYKWADTLRRQALGLKISPSHLMLARRTGKCVWRPLALLLYLPVTHTAAAQAEHARHAVWLWQAAFITL